MDNEKRPMPEPIPEPIHYAYRALGKGEIIQEHDECLCESKTGWQRTNKRTIGTEVPDPLCGAHRIYRRPVRADQVTMQWQPIETAPDDGTLFLVEDPLGQYDDPHPCLLQ